jgi:hypothetical protein
MGRAAAARRRWNDRDAVLDSFDLKIERDDLWERGENLVAENAQLRQQLEEVEGWYRLLQANHAALEADAAQAGRRVTELQTEANRLAAENRELRALDGREVEQGTRNDSRRTTSMIRVSHIVQAVRTHRWATAAVVAIATLLARDPVVRGAVGTAFDRVRQTFGTSEATARDSAETAFIQYAVMLNSRDEAERARREYNENETKLKGDALLEAQDRVRAAKARYLKARLAFLPELARRCQEANVPVPTETAVALTELSREVGK